MFQPMNRGLRIFGACDRSDRRHWLSPVREEDFMAGAYRFHDLGKSLIGFPQSDFHATSLFVVMSLQ
jgi:hypothetical protein